MTLSAYFTVLVILLRAAAALESGKSCVGTSQCDCINSLQDYEYNCYFDKNLPSGNTVTVEISRFSEIRFSCYPESKELEEWTNLIKGINVTGSFDKMTIERCALPENSIRSLLKRLEIDKVKSLFLLYIYNGDKVFADSYFDDMNTTEELWLSNCKIKELPDGVFRGLENLKQLFLTNNQLKSLTPEILEPIKKLKRLELGRNNISTLPEGIFKHVPNLLYLNVYSNKLIDLKRDVFSDIPKLKSLDINNNHITSLSSDIFQNLVFLMDVNLSFNNITHLPEGIFANTSSLTRIRATQSYNGKTNVSGIPSGLFSNLTALKNIQMNCNNLTQLPADIFRKTYNLTSITLKQNKLTSMPESIFEDTTNLEGIDLSVNRLTRLNDSLFQPLKKLLRLHLEYNKLKFLSRHVFATLVSLKELYLQNNGLTALESNIFSRLIQLKIINLSNNRLNMSENISEGPSNVSNLYNCKNNIEEIYLRNNSITMVYSDWLVDIHLKKLDLSYNKIERLDTSDLQFASSSIVVNLSNNNISNVDLHVLEQLAIANRQESACTESSCKRDVNIILQNNPIICDCRAYFLAKYFNDGVNHPTHKYVNLYPDKLYCHSPSNLKNISLSTLNLYDLYCSLDQVKSYDDRNSCPTNCNCSYRPADKTLVVDCNNLNVTELPRTLPEGKFINDTELLLSNKNLISLQDVSSLISHYKVTKLSLSANKLKSIDELHVSPMLKVLELDNNDISLLSENAIKKLNKTSNATVITLHNNPWRCTCETKYLLNFLQARFHKIPFINNITCKDTGKPIIELSVDDLCEFSLTMIIICVSLAAFGVLFGTLIALYYKYQHEIKVWMFAHKICLWLVAEKEIDRNKKYDAFVSYSHQDESFVVEHLVPELESGDHPFKLCLHYRDWIVGDWIPGQIIKSVEDSRRTIVILSPNFLDSIWGKMEFRTAHLKAIKERCARVIIILLKDIGPTDKLDPELKAYLTMNTYVKWGDPWFWQKLKYALPHPQQYCKQRPMSITKELMNVNGNIRLNKLNVAPCLDILNKEKEKKKNNSKHKLHSIKCFDL